MLTKKPRVGDKVSCPGYQNVGRARVACGTAVLGTITRIDDRMAHWKTDAGQDSMFIWGFTHRGETEGNVIDDGGDRVLLNTEFSEVP